MMKQHILSKSTFMLGCQCPLRLYLHKFQPDLRNPMDEEQESIFASGTDVGLLAQGLFPGGVNAAPPDPYSFHLSVAKTQELIEAGESIIYEAAFIYDGVLCAIDLLVKRDGKWYAYEVKGSTKVKDPFLLDASLQYFVMTHAGIALADISIVHLNNQYVRKGELSVEGLFQRVSVLDEVKSKQGFVAEHIAAFKALVLDKKEPVVAPGPQCSSPYPCDFTVHCHKNLVEEVADHGKESFAKDPIHTFLQGINHPVYFFDFETIMPAIPLFDDSRPYQQIPFQYSLHVQKQQDGKLIHKAFLGDGITDPRPGLIAQLIKDIGSEGSILTWNKAFEMTRLKELARDFPIYKEAIGNLLDRIIDLADPFRKKLYTHPAFEGSWSIKYVLPALVPSLSYGDLVIQEGGMASQLYTELQHQTTAVQAESRQHLLDYCALDTLAMVKILERLQEGVKR